MLKVTKLVSDTAATLVSPTPKSVLLLIIPTSTAQGWGPNLDGEPRSIPEWLGFPRSPIVPPRTCAVHLALSPHCPYPDDTPVESWLKVVGKVCGVAESRVGASVASLRN